MRELNLKTLLLGGVAIVWAVGAASAAGRDDGSVALSVRWVGGGAASSQTSGDLAVNNAGIGGFGSNIPKSVDRIRITYSSASTQCCVAFDPRDSRLGGRNVVLTNLRAESADITLAGFPGTSVPSGGYAATCNTNPSEIRLSCDDDSFATPSFVSDVRHVIIVGGTRTEVGDLTVFPVPFLLVDALVPGPGGVAASPLSARLTIVEAQDGVLPQSIQLQAQQSSNSNAGIATISGCNDLVGPLCSPGGSLQVSGYQVISAPIPYALGNAGLRVVASNASGRKLDTAYSFTINSLSTPTRTATSIPTSTRTFTATRTATRTYTVTPTATKTATRRPTVTAAPTRTRTNTPTRTRTSTPTVTPSNTSTPTLTATRTPTRTRTITLTPTATYTATVDTSCSNAPEPHPVGADSLRIIDSADADERRVKLHIHRETGIDSLPVSDPTFCGAELRIVGTGRGDGSAIITLPPGLWDPVGYPRASRGYRYWDPLVRFGIREVRLVPYTDRRGGSLVISGGGAGWPYRITQRQSMINFRLQIGNDVYCSEFRDLSTNRVGRVGARNGVKPRTCSATP